MVTPVFTCALSLSGFFRASASRLHHLETSLWHSLIVSNVMKQCFPQKRLSHTTLCLLLQQIPSLHSQEAYGEFFSRRLQKRKLTRSLTSILLTILTSLRKEPCEVTYLITIDI